MPGKRRKRSAAAAPKSTTAAPKFEVGDRVLYVCKMDNGTYDRFEAVGWSARWISLVRRHGNAWE